MSARRRMAWRALLPMVALVAAACGGTQTPSASPGVAGSGPADTGSETAPPNGSFDPASTTLDLSTDAIVAAAGQENADRASQRALTDMTGYLGPDAPALAAALDRQAADGLWKLVDSANSSTTDMRLASVRLPRVTDPVDTTLVPPPGMALLGPWVASMIIVDAPSSWETVYSDSKHSEDEVVIGPNKGTVTTDTSTSIAPSGSRLVVDVTTKQVGEVSDAAGHLIFRINAVGHGHVDIQACPDAQGTAQASMEFSANESYFASSDAGRSGSSWQEDDKAEAKILADDEANVDHVGIELKASIANKGGSRAAGAGQSDLSAYTMDVAGTMTIGQNGSGTPGAGTFNARNVTRAQVDEAYKATDKFLGIVAWTSAKAAERFWRSGKCIQVVVDPEGGDVAANSATSVTATVRHRFDGNELNKPVEATMTGVKSIEPAGQRQPAPATFTYAAGAKPGEAGDVTFKSVSNRGIGETTVKFTVGGGWKTESDGSTPLAYKGQKCNGLEGVWQIVGKIDSEGIKTTTTWIATIDGTTLVGTATYKSTTVVSTPAGSVVTKSTGAGTASVAMNADGTITMTIAPMMVTTTGAGQGLTLQEPATGFTWTSGGTCPA